MTIADSGAYRAVTVTGPTGLARSVAAWSSGRFMHRPSFALRLREVDYAPVPVSEDFSVSGGGGNDSEPLQQYPRDADGAALMALPLGISTPLAELADDVRSDGALESIDVSLFGLPYSDTTYWINIGNFFYLITKEGDSQGIISIC